MNCEIESVKEKVVTKCVAQLVTVLCDRVASDSGTLETEHETVEEEKGGERRRRRRRTKCCERVKLFADSVFVLDSNIVRAISL